MLAGVGKMLRFGLVAKGAWRPSLLHGRVWSACLAASCGAEVALGVLILVGHWLSLVGLAVLPIFTWYGARATASGHGCNCMPGSSDPTSGARRRLSYLGLIARNLALGVSLVVSVMAGSILEEATAYDVAPVVAMVPICVVSLRGAIGLLRGLWKQPIPTRVGVFLQGLFEFQRKVTLARRS